MERDKDVYNRFLPCYNDREAMRASALRLPEDV